MLSSQKLTPVIMGLLGATLGAEEQRIIAALNPVGFILFKRNCQSAEQLTQLTKQLRALSTLTTPLIFIDEEGGRVSRINWLDYKAPPPRKIGEIFEHNAEKGLEAARLNGFIIAAQLQKLGITVDCFPLGDIALPQTSSVIGDRAFGACPNMVAQLCAATISGMLAGGVYPVLKHAPGHGRAVVDSHLELPVVDSDLAQLNADMEPFAINNQVPLIMTAHVVYNALDNAHCATQSSKIINQTMRQKLGMGGLIVADDLNMNALTGTLRERAEKSLNAGCDLVLACSGNLKGEGDLTLLQNVEQLKGLNASAETLARLATLPNLHAPKAETVANATQQMLKLLA